MMNAAIPLKVLGCFGIWRPKTWTSQWAKRLYNVYSIFILFVIFTFTFVFLIYILKDGEDIVIVVDDLSILAGLLSFDIKVLNIFIRRDDFIKFDSVLLENYCCPRDGNEIAILKKYNDSDRSNSMFYQIICCTTATLFIIGTLVIQKSDVTLPYIVWTPFDTETKLGFWASYSYQTFATLIVASLFPSIDYFTVMMIRQISVQLEIMKYRLHLIPELLAGNNQEFFSLQHEFMVLKDCICHHKCILQIGRKLNELLNWMIFVQFLMTVLALCVVAYQLTILPVGTVKFWSKIGAFNSYIFQIFLYCFYGEEIKQQSKAIADVIYEMNWISLSNGAKKYLIIMMLNTSRPIKLTSGSIITMDLDTFVTILKISYSAFSVLKSI